MSAHKINHMVEQRPSPRPLDTVFQALANPTRRAMVRRLAAGERSVTELGEPFSMSLAGVSKHIQTLERAGLVRRRIEGRTHYCRLDPAPLDAVQEWLRATERFWTARLDALEDALEREDDPDLDSPSTDSP